MRGVRLLVTKHRLLTSDRYVVSHCDETGTPEDPWVSARVGRLLVRTRVRFLDPAATDPAFTFRSRSAVDLGGGYEVHDSHGLELARFGRPRRRRLQVWFQAPGIDAAGRPSRGPGSRGRVQRGPGSRGRVQRGLGSRDGLQGEPGSRGWLSGLLAPPAPFALDLADRVTGEVVLGLRRLPGRQVRVLVEVADSRVDPRAAAALAVGVVSVLSR